jgi:hypothetical protein
MDCVKKGLVGGVGVNMNVAQGIAGTADVIYGFAKDKKNSYHCQLLETEEFEPTKENIFNSIKASSRVQSALKDALSGRKRVHMIMGHLCLQGHQNQTEGGWGSQMDIQIWGSILR